MVDNSLKEFVSRHVWLGGEIVGNGHQVMDITLEDLLEELQHRLVQVCLVRDVVVTVNFPVDLVCTESLYDVIALPLRPEQIHLIERPLYLVYLVNPLDPGPALQNLAYNWIIIAR